MDRVFRDFPRLRGYILRITRGIKGIMSQSFVGDLDNSIIKFHNIHYQQLSDIREVYGKELQIGNAPNGSDYQHAGVHELGHCLVAQLTKYLGFRSSDTDLGQDVFARYILDEALKIAIVPADDFRGILKFSEDLRYEADADVLEFMDSDNYDKYRKNKILTISEYVLARNGAEAVAEAFVDWYANGAEAKALSKEIVGIVNKLFKEVPMMDVEKGLADTSTKEKPRKTTPRFLLEGWALYEGGDYETKTLKGRKIQYEKNGFDFIGIKSDAPEWAKNEYDEWVSD